MRKSIFIYLVSIDLILKVENYIIRKENCVWMYFMDIKIFNKVGDGGEFL